MSKKRRNLDGFYFRVRRDGEWMTICYSDMEQCERDEIARRTETMTLAEQAAWWRSIANGIADQLYDMGEKLDVVCE